MQVQQPERRSALRSSPSTASPKAKGKAKAKVNPMVKQKAAAKKKVAAKKKAARKAEAEVPKAEAAEPTATTTKNLKRPAAALALPGTSGLAASFKRITSPVLFLDLSLLNPLYCFPR